MKHAHEQILQKRRDLRHVREPKRFVLNDLKKLEDVRSVERDAAENKSVEAGPQRIHVCWATPA